MNKIYSSLFLYCLASILGKYCRFIHLENAKCNGGFERIGNEPLFVEYDIRVKETEAVSKFLGKQLQDYSVVQKRQRFNERLINFKDVLNDEI